MAASLPITPQRPKISPAFSGGANRPTSARPEDCAAPRPVPASPPTQRNTCSAAKVVPNALLNATVSWGVA